MNHKWNQWILGCGAVVVALVAHATDGAVAARPEAQSGAAPAPVLAASEARLPYGAGYEARQGRGRSVQGDSGSHGTPVGQRHQGRRRSARW